MNTILLQGLLFQINSEAERFLPLELEYECSKKQINYARGGRQKACSTAGGKSSTTLNTKPCSSQYFGFRAAVVSISVKDNIGAFCFLECSLTSGNPCDCQILLLKREREREWLTYYGVAIGLLLHHAQCTLEVSHGPSLLL